MTFQDRNLGHLIGEEARSRNTTPSLLRGSPRWREYPLPETYPALRSIGTNQLSSTVIHLSIHGNTAGSVVEYRRNCLYSSCAFPVDVQMTANNTLADGFRKLPNFTRPSETADSLSQRPLRHLQRNKQQQVFGDVLVLRYFVVSGVFAVYAPCQPSSQVSFFFVSMPSVR